jgi:hypothetical protein
MTAKLSAITNSIDLEQELILLVMSLIYSVFRQQEAAGAPFFLLEFICFLCHSINP